MNDHTMHTEHEHVHGTECGHRSIRHDDHTDYLHAGHLHHVHGDHVDEHALADSGANPAACTPEHACGVHDGGHEHSADCGHDPVPHADHVDYLVNGHLHRPHATHCDDHGVLQTA